MIKVCHITSAHPWNDIRIFHKECKSLSNNGFDVTLISFGSPNGMIDNVNLVNAGSVPSGRRERMGKGRAIIRKLALRQDAMIYHFHDPELIPVAKNLVKRGKKVIYDIHEDVPRQLLTKPYLNKYIAKLISFFFEKYENMSVRHFSALCCATPYIAKRFSKFHTLVRDINNFPLLSEIPQQFSGVKEKQNKICYIGAISEIRGIIPLIDSLALCKGVTLELAGNFSEGALKDKARVSPGWKFVHELGQIDRSEALRIKSQCIAGIVTFLPVENHIHAQPNKIFEYMASGLPVIGSDFPLWRELIEDNGCGFCVNPDSPEDIASAVMKLVSDHQLAEKMGEKGYLTVKEKYSWQTEEDKLVALYHLVSEKKTLLEIE